MWARPMLPEFGLSGGKSQRAEWLNLGGLKVASSSYSERKIARAALTETASSDCGYPKQNNRKVYFLQETREQYPRFLSQGRTLTLIFRRLLDGRQNVRLRGQHIHSLSAKSLRSASMERSGRSWEARRKAPSARTNVAQSVRAELLRLSAMPPGGSASSSCWSMQDGNRPASARLIS